MPTVEKNYKADFLIMRKLILEVDGKSHNSLSRSTKDDKRDEILKQLGYTTIRFKDAETFETEKCVKRIREGIEQIPKIHNCMFCAEPHHHVPMMNKIWCMSAGKYLEEN